MADRVGKTTEARNVGDASAASMDAAARRRATRINADLKRLALIAAAAASLLVASAASASAGVKVGLADSDGDTFVDPAWADLGTRFGRAVAPYDVALTPPVAGTPAGDRRIEFDQWVSTAAAARVRPLVAFEASRDPGKRTPDGRPLAPTRAEFATAMSAFVRRYRTVRELAPWNEPNFTTSSNPLARRPALAASYYRVLKSVCRAEGVRCRIAAGEFAGIPGDPYVDAYKAALGDLEPAVWGFHAHTDANRFQAGLDTTAPTTRFFLNRLDDGGRRPRFWIDEVGAYYRDASGRVWGDDSQRATTSFILGLSSLNPRIKRIYYYNLSNECSTPSRCAVQDRGIIAPSPWDGMPLSYDSAGRRRGNYEVIARRGPLITPSPQPHLASRR